MRAKDHTDSMLGSWIGMGILRADLAIRRSDGTMVWHASRALRALPLAWARAENSAGADVYLRPARGESWPIVFLDDVPDSRATMLARKYRSLVVQSSPRGGCHVWLSCSRSLGEDERAAAQRWLAARIAADPASTSGEHPGRLAGFRNWKRGGNWVNVFCRPDALPSWDPESALVDATKLTNQAHEAATRRLVGRDPSMSGREWGWACRLLERGATPNEVYRLLVERARDRRGDDVARYAARTVARATIHVGRPIAATREGGIHP